MNDKYYPQAVSVLAALRSQGVEVKVNRRRALAAIRCLLANLELTGTVTDDPCLLTKAVSCVIDATLFSNEDESNARKVLHYLVGLSANYN